MSEKKLLAILLAAGCVFILFNQIQLMNIFDKKKIYQLFGYCQVTENIRISAGDLKREPFQRLRAEYSEKTVTTRKKSATPFHLDRFTYTVNDEHIREITSATQKATSAYKHAIQSESTDSITRQKTGHLNNLPKDAIDNISRRYFSTKTTNTSTPPDVTINSLTTANITILTPIHATDISTSTQALNPSTSANTLMTITSTKPLINSTQTYTTGIRTFSIKNAVNTSVKGSNRPKRILIYTALFGRTPWRHVPYDYNFTELDGVTPCQVNACQITYTRQQLNTSDAVLFHGRDLPTAKELNNIRQKTRNYDQLWIWFMHESPLYSYLNITSYDGVFNWTATYRPSSEVFIPYYSYRELNTREQRPELGSNFASGKDKMVMAIMSHCSQPRLNFIRKLRKHINVDLYGACKAHINPHLEDCPKGTEKCEKLRKRYKFFLAIENSFCDDYITEKYFSNALKWHVLPVVVGKGNYSDSRIAIPNSYINIGDYNNLSELASYLKYLNSNDTAYNQYFQWTSTYTVELQQGMCKVCKALWERNGAKNKNVQLSRFWGADLTCENMTTILNEYE